MQTVADFPTMLVAYLALCLVLLSWNERLWVKGHGRLIDPPSRATMWRFGFDTVADYDDNQGYCGGREQLWNRFKGRCGVCGDAWEPRPRAHERGGKYYDGTPVRYYTEGDVITVAMGITANHRGWVEFRLCPYDWPDPEDIEYDENGEFVEVSHTCLDKYVLEMADGSGTRFDLPEPYRVGEYSVDVRLPYGLSCQKCLFQWKWNVANSWGTDPDGTSCVGCGPQEQFYACADIVIEPLNGREPNYPPHVPETEPPTPPITVPPPPPPSRRTERPGPPRRTDRPGSRRRTERPVYHTRDPVPPVYSPRAPPPATHPPWDRTPDQGLGDVPTTGWYPNGRGYPTTGVFPDNRGGYPGTDVGTDTGRGYPTTGVFPGNRGGYPGTDTGGRSDVPLTRTPTALPPTTTSAPTTRTTSPSRTPTATTTAAPLPPKKPTKDVPRKPKPSKPKERPKAEKPEVPSFWKWLLVNHPVKKGNPETPVIIPRPTPVPNRTTTKSWWEKLMMLADRTKWGNAAAKSAAEMKEQRSNMTDSATTTTTTPSTTTTMKTTSTRASAVENTTKFVVVNPLPWWAQSVKQKGPAFLFHGWETLDNSLSDADVQEILQEGPQAPVSIVAYSGLLGPEIPATKTKRKKTSGKFLSDDQITAAASRDPAAASRDPAAASRDSANLQIPDPEPYTEEFMNAPGAGGDRESRDILLTNEFGFQAVNQGLPFEAANQNDFYSPDRETGLLPVSRNQVTDDHFALPVGNPLLPGGETNFLPVQQNSPFYAQELICTPTAGWTQYPQMWRWCEFHCRGGYCPPSHCMCA